MTCCIQATYQKSHRKNIPESWSLKCTLKQVISKQILERRKGLTGTFILKMLNPL